jgi:DNA excision repair protein ERCC-4
MKILVDTREHLPYTFERFEGVQVVRGTLETGDYSLVGLEHLACIERKSIDDLLGCLTSGRARFERELARMRPYQLKAVVVECSLRDISRGNYRSQMNPEAALQSVIAFQVRYSVPFVWAGNRAGGEYLTHGLLAKMAREITRQYTAISQVDGC